MQNDETKKQTNESRIQNGKEPLGENQFPGAFFSYPLVTNQQTNK